MYWKDRKQETAYQVPDDVVDLSFRLNCRDLPLDHAYAMRDALERALPWLADEPLVAAYIACGAESGNGWMRPGGDGAIIHLSRRARLNLRLPKQRIKQAMQLERRTLDIDGHQCGICESKVCPLSTHATLFSRHFTPAADDEKVFLGNVERMVEELGVQPLKMMSGLNRVIRTPQQTIGTRSLMIDGLKPQEAVLVQQRGLGEHRELGCGVFLPHKSIDSVHREPA